MKFQNVRITHVIYSWKLSTSVVISTCEMLTNMKKIILNNKITIIII